MTRARLVAVPEQPARAVLYVRVSQVGARHGDAFHSPGLQIEAMQRVVQARGMTVVDTVQDIDRSGRTFVREGLQQVMGMARRREVDVVATYDLSRFGRNTGESLRHIAELRELGVSIVSTTEQIDDSPEGQFMLGQFLGMAQLYSDQVGRRWQQVIARRAEQGRWHGSNAPFGYRLRGRELGGGLEVDPVTGVLMTEAFGRYARGHLVSHIARDLGRARGSVYAVTTLKAGLRNPVYTGRVRVGEQTYPGLHERLVENVTWEAVQQRLARDRRKASRHLAVSHSLVGVMFCAHCGYHLQMHVEPARPQRGQPRRIARVQCRRGLGDGVCVGVGSPPILAVEQAVLEDLRERIVLLRGDHGERAAKQARRARAGVDAGRLGRELLDTERALGQLTADRARRQVTDVAYRLAADELERAAGLLREQLDVAEAVRAAPAPAGAVRLAEALLGRWEVMRADERNRGVRALIGRVEVRRAAFYREPMSTGEGGRVQIVWL